MEEKIINKETSDKISFMTYRHTSKSRLLQITMPAVRIGKGEDGFVIQRYGHITLKTLIFFLYCYMLPHCFCLTPNIVHTNNVL